MQFRDIFNQNTNLVSRVMYFLKWAGIDLKPMLDKDSVKWPVYVIGQMNQIRLPDETRNKLIELGLIMQMKDNKEFVRLHFGQLGE